MRLLLADDHTLFRSSLRSLLEARGLEVVGEASDGREAIGLAGKLRPDLVLMDLSMPVLNGIEATRQLGKRAPNVHVLMLTMHADDVYVRQALKAGARGYLLKDMEPAEVIDAIRRTARGELVVAPAISGKLATILQSGEEPGSAASLAKQLTGRERQILGYVAAGLSNKAIARTVGISNDTVKLHVRHILAKLGLSSRVEAAVFAVQNRKALGMEER